MEVYEIPWENAFPSDVAVDDEGRLWFTDRLTHALGVFDPEARTFRRLATPTAKSGPYGLIRAPDGTMWFGESNASRLGRLDPRTGEITEHLIPELRSGPRLLAWRDGVIWFTAQPEGAYGSFDPATGRSRIWTGRIEQPYGIAATPEGVWIAPRRGWSRRVGATGYARGALLYRVDGEGGEGGEEMATLDVGAAGRRMAAGPDGRVWLTQFSAGKVTGIDPATGETVVLETLPQPSRPYGITVDDLGRVWYAEAELDALVVYDPALQERRRLALPLDATVRNIAVDLPRRRVWLPLSDAGALALLRLPSDS